MAVSVMMMTAMTTTGAAIKARFCSPLEDEVTVGVTVGITVSVGEVVFEETVVLPAEVDNILCCK